MANCCWQDLLPSELILEIFKFLSKHDRYSCYQVCRRWRDILNRAYFWRRFIVFIDTDFLEKSTMNLCKHYNHHIEFLEIGWETPLIQNRWLPLRLPDLTKRMVRCMLKLHENRVQLTAFKLFDWYEVYPFKKIIYHLARFLKIQKRLRTLIFHNINLPKPEAIKILNACIFSNNAIIYLEIRNFVYSFTSVFDSEEFIVYLQKLKLLQELKLDYFILCKQNIIDIITKHASENMLTKLEIYFDQVDIYSSVIPNEKWKELARLCPNLHVSFVFRNFCHYEQIEFIFLMESVPLHSFSLIASTKFDQEISRNFQRTITKLIDNYSGTLENIHLDLKNNEENLDNLLVRAIRKCKKLQRFFFDGMVNDNMQFIQQIYQQKKQWKGLHVRIQPHRYKSLMNIIHIYS